MCGIVDVGNSILSLHHLGRNVRCQDDATQQQANDNDVDEIGYVMIEQFISLCESFNPPNNAVSFAAHLEKGDELSMGLAQDVAVLGEIVASGAEGGHAPVQVHLHPQLVPWPQHSTCFSPFVLLIVAIVDETITKTTAIVAHCIP